MTENEKIELFDKWYDENYDEWAEGEEGIALREELEQAFKSGIATLEKENAELKADNDARKFAMAMSEKVEKQLREENSKLKEALEGYKKIAKWCDKCDKIAELKSENQKWKDEWQEQVQKATDEGYARTLQTIQLTKAKDLLLRFIELKNKPCASGHSINMLLYENICVETEQFISEV